MTRMYVFCVDLIDFDIFAQRINVKDFKALCDENSLNTFNGFIFVDAEWDIIFHKSKNKLEELVELYRLTGCDMEYCNKIKILKFRYKTCIDIAKLIGAI